MSFFRCCCWLPSGSMVGGTGTTPNDALCPECRSLRVQVAWNILITGRRWLFLLDTKWDKTREVLGIRLRVSSKGSSARAFNLQIPSQELSQGPHPQHFKPVLPGQKPCSDQSPHHATPTLPPCVPFLYYHSTCVNICPHHSPLRQGSICVYLPCPLDWEKPLGLSCGSNPSTETGTNEALM